MRLGIKKVGSFMGDCLIITDNETNKNVEVMSLQLAGVLKSSRNTGSFPHGGWDKNANGTITIYHDDEREKHEVSFTLSELTELLQSQK